MQTVVIESIESRVPGRPSRSRNTRLLPFVFLATVAVFAWRYMGPKKTLASAGWVNNWDNAFVQSRASGKPVLALFSADWCPSCRKFESEVLGDSQVEQYLRDHYTLVVVDVTESSGPNITRAQELNVTAIPLLILYTQTGNQKARAIGMPAGTFLGWLKSGGTELGSVFGG